MDVGLGMLLSTRDGKDAGTVDRLILDPGTGVVKAIVIGRGTIRQHRVEVPMGALEIGSDGEVRLSYTMDQIEKQSPFDAGKYGPPPAGYVSPLGHPSEALYWPTDAEERPEGATREGEEGQRAVFQRQDLENAVIREGSAVISRDGKRVGTVHRLTYDPNSGVLRHFVVREGMLFTKDVELPTSLIARVDDGIMHLGVDIDELRAHESA